MRVLRPSFTSSLFSLILVLSAILHSTTSAQTSAQTIETRPAPSAATSATVVPMQVRYDGVAARGIATAATSAASITFLIYKDEKGGDPLWIETQNVATDTAGRYEVDLGSTYSAGLPPGLFGTGEARWLEVQIAGEPTAPRSLLTSVPYALKAADAATLGGLPASAFALAGTSTGLFSTKADGITSDTASNVTTTGGTANYVPMFTGSSTIANSVIVQDGSSIGIGKVPNTSAILDVNGGMIMRGNMTVSRTGNATASLAYPSYGFDFFSNVYNSSTKATENPYFQLESEPTGNDTASPSATFNLLFSNNGSRPAETGFSVNPAGTVNFASGQTFPGTGTITGITTTSPLTGGGTSGPVALGLNTSALETTLNGKYAQLGAANTFSASQTITGGLTASGKVMASGGVTTPAVLVSSSTPPSTDYSLEVYSTNTRTAGIGMESGGTDAAIAVNNTSSGGRDYWIDSGGAGAGIGAGNFAIYDASGGGTRLVINSSGQVGIGTLTPSFPLEAVADPSIVEDGLSGEGTYYGPAFFNSSTGSGSNGATGYGGSTDGSSGSTGGSGGYFIGGDADTSTDAGYGLFATGGFDAAFASTQDAAFFNGSIKVNGGTISSISTTKLDHPTDPANKYFNHASVQSSELMNMYTGNVTTDSAGQATVRLPEWFEAENADFRYQLTVVGQQAQAWIAKEAGGGEFVIATSPANVKVSWQITAVRQDAYAKAHPLVVEEAKPAREVGFYKHPELYGQPANRQTEWGRNPRMMQRMEAQRAAIRTRQQSPAPRPAVPVNPAHPVMQSALVPQNPRPANALAAQ